MAVTAKFAADFSSFSAAVEKAQVELRSFETGAGRVEKSLNRMVDSFSGRKVIQDATLMADAVTRIGGVTKLTTDELQRLGSQAQTAVAKLRALGLEVPPGIQQIATASQAAQGGIGGIMKALGPLGPAVLGAFSVGAVTAFVKDVVALGGHLVDLRDKTGISVEGLQQLKAAAEVSGNTLDQVTAAVGQMQNRLSSGDASAVGAVKELGLELDDLKRLSPDQQFRALARAIADVEDPADRTRIAVDLFGRGAIDLLPTLVSEIDKVAEHTTTMSTRTAENLDKAGNAWSSFVGRVKVGVADVTSGLIESVSSFQGFLEGVAMLQGNPMGNLNRDMRHLKEETAALAATAKGGLQFAQPLKDAEEQLDATVRSMERYLKAHEARQGAEKKTADESSRLHAVMVARMAASDKEAASIWSLAEATARLGNTLLPVKIETIETTVGIENFNRVLLTMGRDTIPSLDQEMQRLGKTLGDYGPTLDQLGVKFQSFGEFLRKDLGQIIVGAIQGGGDVLRSIGASIGGKLFGADGMFGRSAAALLTKTLGSTIGGALGSVIPGLGTLLGALGGKLLGKLFSNPEKQINPVREAFVQLHGGLDALNQKAHKAGLSLERLLNAKNPKQYQAAVDELNKAFERHQAKLDEAKRLVDGLGDSFSTVMEGAVTDTAQGLEDLGIIAVASIGAAIEAGYTLSEAIAMNRGGLSKLREAYQALGISTEDAFLKEILLQESIVSKNPQLLQAIGALGSSMEALAKLGMLNENTFQSMERVGLAMYRRLQGEVAKVGGSTKDALLPMQGFLHEAARRAKELGIPLDENLQAMIDQSKELGIWKEAGKSASERMVEGLEKIVKKMDEFIERIGRAQRGLGQLTPPGSEASGGAGGRGGSGSPGGGPINNAEDVFAGRRGGLTSASDVVIENVITLDGSVLHRSVSRAQDRALQRRRKLRAA